MDGFINAISSVLTAIFDLILTPILEFFLRHVLGLMIDALKKAFAALLYWLYTSLLSVIDFMVKIFEFFSGSEDVLYTPPAAAGHYGMEHLTVLELFFKVDEIQKAFLAITCLAVGLSFIFTIYAVAKSMSDMALENKNPIGKVLGSALKCCFTFLLVPFLCLFMLKISTIILDGADTALSARTMTASGGSSGKDASLATILWLSSSMDAARNDNYNISCAPGNAGFHDYIRGDFYSGKKSWNYGSKEVQNLFYYDKFHYGMGFVSCIFMIVMLTASILLLIRRIFEILILYLTSPLFVSTMPLDGGGMFRKWKDMFIAKFFSAFSCVFAIRLYVMFVPVFADGTIKLYPANSEISYFLLMLFLIGGAYAIYKSHHMLLSLLHPDAAAAAEQSAGTLFHTARAAYVIMDKTRKAVKSGMRK